MVGLKKGISFILCAAMMMPAGPVAYADTDTQEGSVGSFIDMPEGWARAGLVHGVENGLLKGYETAAGLEIRPAGNITRAELVTTVNRAFGATVTASLEGVTDVKDSDWFATEIAEAVAMKTLTKAEQMRPNDRVTRQEAFTILARAYKLEGGSREDLAAYMDADKVSDYAVDGMGALLKAGYISGSYGKLDPRGYMTRAEFAKVMDSLTSVYIREAGEYSSDATGNVIVSVGGVTLKNMTIDGNLIIADGVGEGDVDLVDLNVTGDIIVKAGGDHSVRLNNVTARSLTIDKEQGNAPLRAVFSGVTSIESISVRTNAIIDTTAADASGKLGPVKTSGNAISSLQLFGWFSTVENHAKDLKLTATGTIDTLIATETTSVSGGADIRNVSNVSGSEINVNDKIVEPEVAKNENPGTANSNSGFGGGNSSSDNSGSHHSGDGGSTGPKELTAAEKLAADKALIERSGDKFSVEIGYYGTYEDVKSGIEVQVNGLKDLYNKDWTVTSENGFEELGKEPGTGTISIVLTSGEVDTEAVTVSVTRLEMTAAEKLAADKALIEGSGDKLAVEIGYYGQYEDVKAGIEGKVNGLEGLYNTNWTVSGLEGLSAATGIQSLTVRLTCGDVTTEAVTVQATRLEMTVQEKYDADLIVIKQYFDAMDLKMGYLTTLEELRTEIGKETLETIGDSFYLSGWAIDSITGFTPRQAGEQTIGVKYATGDLVTESLELTVTVAEPTLADTAVVQKEMLESSADELAVTVYDTYTETNLEDAILARVGAICSGWSIKSMTGFTAGQAGEQTVKVVLCCGDCELDPQPVTDEIAVTVTVKHLTDEEKRELDKATLKKALEGASFSITEIEDIGTIESLVGKEIQKLSLYGFWGAAVHGGFDAGKPGTQQVEIMLSSGYHSDNTWTTAIITINVTVIARTVDEKVAEDQANIKDHGWTGVAFMTDEADAKTAMENTFNSLEGMNYTDWKITTFEGYDSSRGGNPKITFSITSEKAERTLSFENSEILYVYPKSVQVKLTEDKELLEKSGAGLAFNAGVNDTVDTLMAPLAEKANALTGLNYTGWTVATVTGFTVGKTGVQNVTVTLTCDEWDYDEERTVMVTTEGISVAITVNDRSDAEKIAHDKALLQDENFVKSHIVVNISDVNTEGTEVAAAIAAIVNSLDDLYYHNWTAEMLPSNYGDRYVKGKGTQVIGAYLKADGVTTRLDGIQINAPEVLTEAEMLAADKTLLEAFYWDFDQMQLDEVTEECIVEALELCCQYDVPDMHITNGEWKATIVSGKENIHYMNPPEGQYESFTVGFVLSCKGVSTSTLTLKVGAAAF